MARERASATTASEPTPGRTGVIVRPGRAGVIVRPATPADVEPVLALRWALLAEDAHSTDCVPPPPFTPTADGATAAVADGERDASTRDRRARSLVHAQLSTDAQVTLLAYGGDTVVGVVRCMIARDHGLERDGSYGYLASAFVRPGHRRAGVLRALVSAADAWCAARGVREVRLQCSMNNSGGNAAWSALGFLPVAMIRRRLLSDT